MALPAIKLFILFIMSVVLALVGAVLSVVSLSLGIFVLWYGPKAIKDVIKEQFKFMWWLKLFGSRRYKWLLDKTKNYNAQNRNMKEINDLFIYVVYTWNPLDADLSYLEDAIALRKPGTLIFPIDLICHCISFLTEDIQYATAWRIIELMRKRLISDDLRESLDEPLRAATVYKIHIVPTLALINVQQHNEGTIKKLHLEVTELVKQNTEWAIFFIMASCLATLYKTMNPSIEKEPFTDARVKCYLLLLDEGDSSLFALCGNFNLSDYIADKKEV